VPQVLLDQLKVGGRLVAVEGADPVMRATVTTRQSPTALSKVDLFDTVTPRLDGFDAPTRFRF